jgi:hypothetical protein
MRVISSDDVQTIEDEHESRRVRITNFCGVRGQAVPGPQIFLVDYPGQAGVAVRPHFHSVDQFQVFWRGDRVGKHAIRQHFVHYADAYTPYGPIVDAGDGVTYLTVRARPDSGPKYMPESRSQRPVGAGGRQLTVQGDVHVLDHAQDGTVWLLGPFGDGLAVCLAGLRAGQQLPAAQPAGDGTVYLLLEGALDGPGQRVSHGATTVVTVGPGEAVPGVRAAGEGAVILGLSFPGPRH